jgi:retron-type reverse transcriptase
VQEIIPIEDIFEAYHDCRKHKRNRSGALQFEVDLEKNLVDLWEDINNNIWEPRPSTVFIVDKPVTREIFAASFRDRIVHHLVINRLNPLFENCFIYDSYSCRIGKGTHFGINRSKRFINRCCRNNTHPAWILKLETRLCKDLRLITIKQQSDIALKMEIIGKQITGWRNASVGGHSAAR